MKSILFSLIILTFSQGAVANEELATVMKSVGENFKTIAIGLQSGQLTEDTLEASEQLQRNLAAANLLFPDGATTDALKLQYFDLMGRVIAKAMDLEDVIRISMDGAEQDIPSVLKVFSELDKIRKEGHGVFKTE